MLQVPFFFTFRDKNVQAKVDQFEFCTDYDYFVIHREGEISSVKVPVFSAFLDCLPTHWNLRLCPKILHSNVMLIGADCISEVYCP